MMYGVSSLLKSEAILMPFPLGESVLLLHTSAFLASFSVLNLYLKNMYVLSQMLPVPKVTL